MEQVTWYVGIDWGSERHAVCVVDAAGHRREERGVDHTADAVQACLSLGCSASLRWTHETVLWFPRSGGRVLCVHGSGSFHRRIDENW